MSRQFPDGGAAQYRRYASGKNYPAEDWKEAAAPVVEGPDGALMAKPDSQAWEAKTWDGYLYRVERWPAEPQHNFDERWRAIVRLPNGMEKFSTDALGFQHGQMIAEQTGDELAAVAKHLRQRWPELHHEADPDSAWWT